MAQELLQAPVSLLLTPAVTASAKLIWLVAQLRPTPDRPGAGWLSAASGLSRPTVLAGMTSLMNTGWDPLVAAAPGPTVPIPTALLCNKGLGVHTRLLYCHLMMTPGFNHPSGMVTNAALAAQAGVTLPTVLKGLSQLARAEWIKLDRERWRGPTIFELTFPGLARGLEALDQATQRLQFKGHRGELLMREWLNLLVDRSDYQDNATPPILVNPSTKAPLELDRYYSPAVGFEFNGAQHYRATKRFAMDVVNAQQRRDYTKLGICVTHGITLVVVQPQDLTCKGMQAKVEALLPLRALTDYQLLIDFLELQSDQYRRKIAFI